MKTIIEKFHQHPYTLSLKTKISVFVLPFQSMFSHWKNLEQAVG